MQDWINQTLESPVFTWTIPLAAFALGLLSAVAGASCSLPIVGAVVGYSGARTPTDRRTTLLTVLFFIVGTVAAILTLGCLAGLISGLAQSSLGRYWKLFAGIAAILLGLAALKVLPFKLPARKTPESGAPPKGLAGAAVFGFLVGGGVSVCSLCCNPGLFVVLGAVVVRGWALGSAILLTAYAVGFSLPLAAIILGVSLGRMAVKAKKAESVIRIAAGILLIAAGFYLLATM